MPDPDLAVPPPGQPHDVGRLLDVGRERLLHEHVATGLERIHDGAIMLAMRREDRQGVGGDLPEQFAVVGERGGRRARLVDRHQRRHGLAPRRGRGRRDRPRARRRSPGADPGGHERPARNRRSRSGALWSPSQATPPPPAGPAAPARSPRTPRHYPSNPTVPRQAIIRAGQGPIPSFRNQLRKTIGRSLDRSDVPVPPAPALATNLPCSERTRPPRGQITWRSRAGLAAPPPRPQTLNATNAGRPSRAPSSRPPLHTFRGASLHSATGASCPRPRDGLGGRSGLLDANPPGCLS